MASYVPLLGIAGMVGLTVGANLMLTRISHAG
jgi:hypothetical protein